MSDDANGDGRTVTIALWIAASTLLGFFVGMAIGAWIS
jgi:hypothetical protein